MTQSPSVTIVVPTHNRAGLVEQAVESVLAQDHQDLEVLVLDDGSSDDTPAILETFAERHADRFRWSRHENVGQALTLNRGFEMARGELVGYLSSDDLLLPGAVTALGETLARDPETVLCYPAYQVIDETGGVRDTITPPEYSRSESVRLQDTVVGPGALFRRSVIDRIGGWNPDYRYLGDFELWLRMSRAGEFRRVPTTLASWRRHDAALTVADQGLPMARERIRLLDDLYAGEVPDDLRDVRGEAYRNAYILAAIVVAPGANSAGERYYLADSHAREISMAAGPSNPEAKIAEMRETVAEQQRLIAELTRRNELLMRRPLVRLGSRLTPPFLRPVARRLVGRTSRPAP